jgi:hypothetical protein
VIVRRACDAWDRFWFAATDPLPLALVRIALGALMTLWAISLAGQLPDFYTAAGVTGEATSGHPWYAWTLLGAAPGPTRVGAVFLALVLASPALALGWHTRAASVVVFLSTLSLQRSDPYVFNSGDALLRLLCLYVMIAPAGAMLSLDARRGRGMRAIPAWPLRLIQVQVSVMYAAAVWAKLHGVTWRDGSAAAYAMRLPDLARFPLTGPLEHPLLAHAATYGTIAVEGTLAVLLWPRRTRPYALVAGCVFHLAIDLTLRVGFFSFAVLTAYLAFADPAWVRRLGAPADDHRTAGAGDARERPVFDLSARGPL